MYRRLMSSKLFHHFVKHIHAKINNIPPPPPLMQGNEAPRLTPTAMMKLNAYKIIWVDEMRKSFGIRR